MTWILSALWFILWFIIWTLVAALALILLFLVLLAVPIKYRINAATGSNTDVRLRASYLLSLVRVDYIYSEGGGKTIWRIAGFRLRNRKKVKKRKNAEKSAESVKKLNVKPKEIPAAETEEKNKKSIIKKLKKAYAVLTDPRGKTIINLTLEALKKVFKTLRPKYVDISGTVGFADPSKTGMFIGAYEAAAGMFLFRDKVRLSGDFTAEATMLRLNFEVRGKINIARMSVPIIGLVLKKPVRELLKEFMGKGDSDE